MDREARHGAQTPYWVLTLCSQLKNCRTTDDVADVVDALNQGPLFGSKIEDVLDQLRTAQEYKHLQELLLAGVDRLSSSCAVANTSLTEAMALAGSSWSAHLSSWLLKRFPATAGEYLASPHGEIMERLSLFLQSLNCSLDRKTRGFLTAACTRTELSQPALKALVGLTTDCKDNGNVSPLPPKTKTLSFQKEKAQDRQGMAWTRERSIRDLERNLETLNLPAPTSEEGKHKTIAKLLAILKEDLQVCSVTIPLCLRSSYLHKY